MDPEFMSLIDILTQEKGINKDVLLETIKHALQTAYRKKVGKDVDVEIAVDAFSILELHVRPTTLVEELLQGGFQVLKDGSTRSLHLRVIDVHSGVQLLCL